jgi:hypothetical protein
MVKPKHKIDMPSVTEDEALELMIHHLSLAAAYYEATSDNQVDNLKEMTRIMDPKIPGYQNPALVAARYWLITLDKHYDEIKDEEPSRNQVKHEPKKGSAQN